MSKIDQFADDLNLLEGTDRLVYLVDRAKQATSLPKELRTDDRLIGGCISKIWVDVGVVEDARGVGHQLLDRDRVAVHRVVG